jgi:hypothetical protein
MRFQVFKAEFDSDYEKDSKFTEWDIDIWTKENGIEVMTFSTEYGDYCYSKKGALAWIKENYGEIKSINPKDTVTNGW